MKAIQPVKSSMDKVVSSNLNMEKAIVSIRGVLKNRKIGLNRPEPN